MSHSYSVDIESKATVELDIDLAAQWFCGLSDEAQADFFIAVARVATSWPSNQGHQWWLVGKHLATCSCGTDEARSMIDELGCGVRYGRNHAPSSAERTGK